MKLRLALLAALAAPLTFAMAGGALAHNPLDPPEVDAHVDAATRLARKDLAQSLFFCEADPRAKVLASLKRIGEWIEPTRIFDNLSYVGNQFVGVYALETDGGVILFDSGTSVDEAENHIAPGLRKLGIDPKDIRYIVVTHGHWDHFGGALWFQQQYGTPVGLSENDWQMIERQEGTPVLNGRPIPKRDRVITDGQVLKVGSTSVSLYITPGHTPGTVSAIFPIRQGGRQHIVSLLGSTALPDTVEPTAITGGLERYRDSIDRFAKLSRAAKADILLNTHLFAFGGVERLDKARATRNPAVRGNSFVIGPQRIGAFYGLMDHCMQAAEGRIRAKATSAAPHAH
ncbi:MBL fold metallo-hydrolase [Novosphingobium sp.]|uniref:MBL fold metallo-hydrolase n=1 Tax=Novosphingobium sp. TaxID=1874826 RepID=UPI0038BA790F